MRLSRRQRLAQWGSEGWPAGSHQGTATWANLAPHAAAMSLHYRMALAYWLTAACTFRFVQLTQCVSYLQCI